MKRSLLVLGVVVGLGLVGANTPAAACGDKIVDISQGVKFQRALGVNPATILVYVDADRVKRPVKRLVASLSRVGHDVDLVTDQQVVIEALRRSEYDLVIAELGEVALMETVLVPGSSPPRLIPLVLDASDAELALATEDHPYVLSVPGRDNEQILTVDEALRAQVSASASTI
jgi:hypothetical protein